MVKKIIKFIKNRENYKNSFYFRYHFKKGLQKLLVGLHLVKQNDLSRKDTFNWSLYNLHFRGEVQETSKDFAIAIKKDDYIFADSHLKKISNDSKPLHPGWQLLYETIIELKPNKIFELGCGSGIHLNNIGVLLPEAKLYGIDLSKEQIEYAKETCPDLKAEMKQYDATKPIPDGLFPKADVSFTNAVIMHIHQGESHKTALANLFAMSDKHVVLSEKWINHPVMDDIKELLAKKIINWENINFYYKTSEAENNMAVMICSKEQLGYAPLTDYNVMLKGY
jgi:hypothetical protein